MKKYFLFSLLVVATFTLSACGTSTETPPVTPINADEEALSTGSSGGSQSANSIGNENVDKNKLKQEFSGISDTNSSVTTNDVEQTEELKNNMMNVDQNKFENLTAKYSQAIFKTNQGSFTIKFYNEKAPQTVNNFMNLAKLGYYDNVKFHRVIADFMIQGGDQNTKDNALINSWGMGGPGYAIADEFGAGLSNVSGTISMANAGPNTGGSQFFVNVHDNSYLDGKHAVFGEVLAGMDVVTAISKLPVDSYDRPSPAVVIESISLK